MTQSNTFYTEDAYIYGAITYINEIKLFHKLGEFVVNGYDMKSNIINRSFSSLDKAIEYLNKITIDNTKYTTKLRYPCNH